MLHIEISTRKRRLTIVLYGKRALYRPCTWPVAIELETANPIAITNITFI